MSSIFQLQANPPSSPHDLARRHVHSRPHVHTLLRASKVPLWRNRPLGRMRPVSPGPGGNARHPRGLKLCQSIVGPETLEHTTSKICCSPECVGG
ncbi:hypothetical protein C8Q78DRAFT_613000 [Trametes maxima]|nr:hypothetical protein C8Q78DRAFT_613000 [Trametes maxima]